MKIRNILIFIVIIYLASIVFGLIFTSTRIDVLLLDMGLEQAFFLCYNICIIVVFTLIILHHFGKLEIDMLTLFNITLILNIIFHISYFVWEMYKYTYLYNIDMKLSEMIGSYWIKPNGLISNVIMLLILYLLVNVNKDEKLEIGGNQCE